MKRIACAFLLIAAATPLTPRVFADKIRLKDKTAVTGDVLQINDDSVIIRLPREAVATVNSEVLPPPLAMGAAAPAFTAVDLNGKQRSVGPKLAKATLLHFWVHWCPHCRSDAPQIQALYDQYKEDPNVQVITINLDQEKEKVLSTIAKSAMTYPVVMDLDPASQVSKNGSIHELYQINGFPATFLIDGEGIIRYKRSGSFVEGRDDLKGEIQKLLVPS